MKKLYLDKYLTVDGGWNTGLAFWTGTLHPETKEIKLLPEIRRRNGQGKKLRYMWSNFENLLVKYEKEKLCLDSCIIEGIELWEGSLKSMTSAKRGDIFTLALLIGGYGRICHEYGLALKYILPSEWKGQLDDASVKYITHLINGEKYSSSHITDAVGIGLNEMGIFKRKK